MDFAMHYTEEQEKFRKEVQEWIKKNAPENMRSPIDGDTRNDAFFAFWREKHKELGDKGWLHPTFPKQYGGGGLSGEYESILQEEFIKNQIPGHFSSGQIMAALVVWGTEEQKQKFLKPLLTGRIGGWQKYTEPQSGTDLANCQTTAVKDGDDYILNGSNRFISGVQRPDMIFGPARTDPDAPRHRNLGFFMIPFPHPGVEIVDQKMVNNGAQHFIFLHDARIPADRLLGGENQGWQVLNTVMELEHGGRGVVFPRDDQNESLIKFMQESKAKGEAVGDNPVLQQATAAAYIDSHINGLFQKRNYAYHMDGTEMNWEGPNGALFTRDFALRNVSRTRDIMGMLAHLGSHDPRNVHGAVQETFERGSFIRMHGAGSRNINKVIVARRIGISRTKERAATLASV